MASESHFLLRRVAPIGILCLLAGPFAAAQWVVSASKAVCPSASFSRIQDAVNAASPGDSIRVCKGIYAEQVVIGKSLLLEADSGATLMPVSMQQNSTSLYDGSPLTVALLVKNAPNVSIDGLTIDGSSAGITACSPQLFGVAFQNASGSLNRAAVRNFKLAPDLDGCQSGSGVFVESGGGGSSEVVVENSSIHDFQKNGITADETGSQVTISGNVVTGLGPTSGAAQNGIQIGYGAAGSILNNSVTNLVWSPCTTVASCQAVATGILVYASDGITVMGNSSRVEQVGVFIAANSASVMDNQTSSSAVFDGIHIEGNSNQVQHNQVFDSSESGIFLSGNNNLIEYNSVTEASIGILVGSDSTGNVLKSNQVWDAPILVEDPSVRTRSWLLQPLR